MKSLDINGARVVVRAYDTDPRRFVIRDTVTGARSPEYPTRQAARIALHSLGLRDLMHS